MPCCGCCGNGFLFGHLMYILEKLAAFCAMSAIISCIVVTVLISIGIGVGVGYNYCFVDSKTAKLTAIERAKNSKNPAKLPQPPNLFPFSGESSNETGDTTINHNTIIEYPPPTKAPTFPDVPLIPVSVFPGTPPTFSVGVPDVTILSTSKSSPVLPISPSVVHPTATQAPIISSPDSSAPEISSPDSSTPESFPNIPPHSPFFSGSYRRIPTILKDRPVSELKPGRLNLQRLKVRPFNVKTPGEFDANQVDEDFGEVKPIEDTHYTEVLKDRPTVRKAKYRRRKPAQRNPINKKVTKATTFMPTIVIPLKKYSNLSPLVSKILAQNKNVTLQFISL
ncbi:hypothetical protein ABMA27_016491 [Loxostege sticticalis]|uniref:Uncharacterized protein n=1 Tax=Loxostege sticticalis TaxID=481309 RepID=A0ABR3I2F8_LOXSC